MPMSPGKAMGIAGIAAAALAAVAASGLYALLASANIFTADNTFTGGANALTVGTPTADTTSDVLIEASAATQTPLGIELATSQTANAFEVKSQGGTVVNWLNPEGYPLGTAAKFWYGSDHFLHTSSFSTPSGPLGLVRTTSGTGTATNHLSLYNGALGVSGIESGTDTNSRTYLGNDGGGDTGLSPGIGRMVFRAKCDLSALSDAGETYTVLIGFTDTVSSASATDGVYFNYTHGTNDGEYQVTNANGGARTSTDTNVAALAGTWAIFEIDLNAAASAVTCKINGTTVSTVTTNLPAAGTEFSYGVGIIKSAGTTERIIYCDYVELLIVPTSQ